MVGWVEVSIETGPHTVEEGVVQWRSWKVELLVEELMTHSLAEEYTRNSLHQENPGIHIRKVHTQGTHTTHLVRNSLSLQTDIFP